MGYPNNELIAPAVLVNNPGITKEEFVTLLDQTHSSTFTEFKIKDPWDSFEPDDGLDWIYYHRGLWGLGEILKLRATNSYKIFKQSTHDTNGLLLNSPSFRIKNLKEQEKASARFVVSTHLRNILEKTKIINDLSWNKLEVGDIWQCIDGSETGLVTKIYKETIFEEDKDDQDDLDEIDFEDGDTVPRYTYRMKIRPFYPKYRREKFCTIEELLASWPQFNPDFMYDFSQERGNFGVVHGASNFRWVQKKGKYYLNEQTFDVIPVSKEGLDYGYTGLILTAQALSHQAWKLLSYKGLIHLNEFFRDFPESRKVYEQAVWDSHTSLHAKRKDMTIFDLLRFRTHAL